MPKTPLHVEPDQVALHDAKPVKDSMMRCHHVSKELGSITEAPTANGSTLMISASGSETGSADKIDSNSMTPSADVSPYIQCRTYPG